MTASSCRACVPPDGAQTALYTAMELAPSDGELRYKVALDFEQRDMIREAIAIIRPGGLSRRRTAATNPTASGASASEREEREREARPAAAREPARDAGPARAAARPAPAAAPPAPAGATSALRASRSSSRALRSRP